MNHKHVSVQYSWSQLTGMGWRQRQSEHKGHLLQEEDLRPQVSYFLLKIFFLILQNSSTVRNLYTKFNIRAIHCHIAIVFSSHSKNMKRPAAREPLEITWFRLQKNKFRTFSLKPNNLSYSIQACGYKINTNPALHSVTASGLSMCIEKVDGPSYGTLSLSSALQQNHKPLS